MVLSICKPLLFKQPGFSGRWASPCVSACPTALYHPEFEQVWTAMKRFFVLRSKESVPNSQIVSTILKRLFPKEKRKSQSRSCRSCNRSSCKMLNQDSNISL